MAIKIDVLVDITQTIPQLLQVCPTGVFMDLPFQAQLRKEVFLDDILESKGGSFLRGLGRSPILAEFLESWILDQGRGLLVRALEAIT